MTCTFTVALCTHNHASRLERTLSDLHHIHPPKATWEFLVIDNASQDGTATLLARNNWPPGWNVRVVREETLGLSNARNAAIKEASGEYVIFMDDDETADPDWLCAFERLVESRRPDAFGGRIKVLFEDARPDWLTDELLGFLGELNRSDTIVQLTKPAATFFGGNFGIRRDVCMKVGGFDPMLGRKGNKNTGGEDVDYYRRLLDAGCDVWWTPEAVIHHRIQGVRLTRCYFLDLHYCQGRVGAIYRRGTGSRIPPRYLYGQLLRAVAAAWSGFRADGRIATLRREMNVAYFVGLILGWAFGPRR